MTRIRTGIAWISFALIIAALSFAQPAHATIQYSVSVAHPEKHILTITIRVPEVRDRLTLQMPAWNTLYQIRDFSSHMMQVSATGEAGNLLPIVKLDKQTWQVAGNGAVLINYSTYWDEPGPFASQLNSDHAFLNPGMLLLYVPERRSEDTTLTFENVPANWGVAVELSPAKASASRTTTYVAASYEALIDAPIELGRFKEYRIEAGNRPIRIAVHGELRDDSALKDAITRIVNYETSLMGGAPFPEYLFLFHVGENFGGGGMEHANSTAIAGENAAQLPAYAAHEFFHAWNVKRIRPQSLEPVDYTKEMWTRSLWFAEGVTNTYGSYALVRSGLWSNQQFYAELADQIRELESRPAHRWQSAEQSSLDAWLEKYPSYNRPDESISYYNKGQLLGIALDIFIRDSTENRASLDDVMRRLNEEYALRGRFYDERRDLRAVIEGVIASQSPDNRAPDAKANVAEFFARYVSGTEEIPFDDLLRKAGLDLRHVTQKSEPAYEVQELATVTKKQQHIREGMLRGTVDRTAP